MHRQTSLFAMLFEVVDSYNYKALSFKLLKATSECARFPTVTITAPVGWIILGGGAYVDWQSPPCAPPCPTGNLLTGMYPDSTLTTWTVASKPHPILSAAKITAYCIVAQMRNRTRISPNDYIVKQTNGALPKQQAILPLTFIVVGGGVKVNYNSANSSGALLYGSYPTSTVALDGWEGSAKIFGPASITVWAIGLKKSFLTNNGMVVTSFKLTSPAAKYPSQTFVKPGFLLTGAGALIGGPPIRNFLTASFPGDRQTVVAKGKDFLPDDPESITAYVIGF